MRCESCGFFVGESKNFFKGFKSGIFDLFYLLAMPTGHLLFKNLLMKIILNKGIND